MKAQNKPHLTPQFQDKAGLLLLKKEKCLYSYRATEILRLRHDSDNDTYIDVAHTDPKYFHINHNLLFHFWQRALNTGESFDLRNICSLDKDDEFYKTYKDPDLDLEGKEKLAARVKVISPHALF